MAFLTGASWLRAHPGHEGDELTWDFSHLAAYPIATLICFVSLAGAGFAGWLLLRRSTTIPVQSLRRSQPSRGK
jgi:hypothetical protein